MSRRHLEPPGYDAKHMNPRQSWRNSTVIPPRTVLCGRLARPTVRKSLSDCKSARQPHEQGFPSGGIGAGVAAYGKRHPGGGRLHVVSERGVQQ